MRRALKNVFGRGADRLKSKRRDATLLHADDIETGGVVQKFTQRDLVGWLVLPEGETTLKIDVYLDEVLFASTWTSADVASGVGLPARKFHLKFKDIWKFAKPDSQLTVRHGEKVLLIGGYGFSRAAGVKGELDKAALKRWLGKGYVFNQFGSLQLSKEHDHDWRKKAIELYRMVNDAMMEIRGIPLSICYGTLLGAVREGNFIGHDHDLDTCYICKAEDGKNAKAEVATLARALKERGFEIAMKPSCTYVGHKDFEEFSIDVFHLYFDKEGVLQFPFGSASQEPFLKSDFHGYTKITIDGEEVDVVDDPEIFVSRLYGEGWAMPNPGFSWKRARVRQARDGRLTRAEMEAVFNV